jgi:hypothetical protein
MELAEGVIHPVRAQVRGLAVEKGVPLEIGELIEIKPVPGDYGRQLGREHERAVPQILGVVQMGGAEDAVSDMRECSVGDVMEKAGDLFRESRAEMPEEQENSDGMLVSGVAVDRVEGLREPVLLDSFEPLKTLGEDKIPDDGLIHEILAIHFILEVHESIALTTF